MDMGGGLSKVGFSDNPNRRSRTLGGVPVLYQSDWSSNAEQVEKAAHEILRLSGKHVKKELFSVALPDAIEAIGCALKSVGQDVHKEPLKSCREERIVVPLTLKERKELGAAASRVGLKVSTYIRMKTLEAIRKPEPS
ncbi:MAG: GIY-YIG nuclease family protein [Roseibium sp.]|nr:GIY-YIG nuclease family protein [Roseibium sp.]